MILDFLCYFIETIHSTMRYIYLFYRYYQHRFGFSRWLCKIQEVQFHANKYKRIVWPYTCNYWTRYSGSTDNCYLSLHSSTWKILNTRFYGRVFQYDSINRVTVYVHVELLFKIVSFCFVSEYQVVEIQILYSSWLIFL